MCLNDPADRINFNFSKIRPFLFNFLTSCDWAINVTYIYDVVIVLLLYNVINVEFDLINKNHIIVI